MFSKKYKMVLAAAVTVAGLGMGASIAAGGSSSIEDQIPEHLRLENLPERVTVADADGNVAGYVDRDQLLSATRSDPDSRVDDRPLPVYDADGRQVGSWHLNLGFVASGETPDRSPVTTAVHVETPGVQDG